MPKKLHNQLAWYLDQAHGNLVVARKISALIGETALSNNVRDAIESVERAFNRITTTNTNTHENQKVAKEKVPDKVRKQQLKRIKPANRHVGGQ